MYLCFRPKKKQSVSSAATKVLGPSARNMAGGSPRPQRGLRPRSSLASVRLHGSGEVGEVTVTEGTVNALIRAACKGWALLARLVCRGAGQCQHWVPHLRCGGWGTYRAGGLAPPPLLPQLRRSKWKQESEECDDHLGLWPFWLNLFRDRLNKKLSSLLLLSCK